ncbi:MAG: hypothetical protein ACFFDN_01625 [Candidatus Hodarchaeota archaeon]
MKIINYGLNSRAWFRDFERKFYKKVAPRLKPRYLNCFDVLGKSLSYFVFEHQDVKNLCLFDLDDGSGLQEDSCKIKYDFLKSLIKKENVNDYVIFKAQLNYHKPFYDFYKDINRTIPLGYFPENMKTLIKYKKKYIKNKKIPGERDIDILWIGTILPTMGENMIWPKNLNLKYWSYGKRLAGFKALQEISKKRNDLNIICTDKKVALKDYFKLIDRSKICFDFPGVGEFTKRFVECIVLQKCILSFKKIQTLHFKLKENHHYLSILIDDDIDYSYSIFPNKQFKNSIMIRNLEITPKESLLNKMENKIDDCINNPDLISDIESHTKEIQEFITPDFLISYIIKEAMNYFFRNDSIKK